VNDPEQDARLAMQVLADQIAAFNRLGGEAPDALLACHHLTTRGEASAGFDALFKSLRGPAPDEATAHAAIRRLLDGRARAMAGRWPMPCRGFQWRAGILSCRPGCGGNSRRRA